MSKATPLVTIFGGSGFIGRYVANRMAQAGWRVRVAVRRPNEAMYVKTYGTVGQVEPILANIRDEDSTREAIAGADVVINCTGIFFEVSKQKFNAVHVDGSARVARIATDEGVKQLVHLSSLGADSESDSKYLQSKANGEQAVLANFPSAAILRPSAVFGTEDKFLNRIAGFSRFTPVLPVIGAHTKFQPVFVGDIAKAVEVAITNSAAGIFELGGPEVATMRELTEITMDVVQRKRFLVNAPFWIVGIKAWFFDMGAAMLGGLFPALITRDQVKFLRHDNVVADSAKTFTDLDIKPTTMEAVLENYLYCYRPNGQYTAITDSGKNLNV